MSERTKWEYMAQPASGDLLAALRPLGEEGWELTAIIQHPEHGGVLLCKRPKSLIEFATELPKEPNG